MRRIWLSLALALTLFTGGSSGSAIAQQSSCHHTFPCPPPASLGVGRLFTSGGEINHSQADGFVAGTGLTNTTTVVRSGSRAFTSPIGAANFGSVSPVTVSGTTYFAREYFYVAGSLPANPFTLLRYFSAVSLLGVSIDASGNVTATSADGASSILSAAVVPDRWYRLEISLNVNTAGIDTATARLDGVEFFSNTAAITNSLIAAVQFGRVSGDTTVALYFDDLALNDSNGASQNSFPGNGRVVLLKPVSDNARSALWTGGAGGTTNLWDAVDNMPPTGTATETNVTQIEHAGGAAGTTDAYSANLETYASKGIGALDTINVVSMTFIDGEDIATGTKLLRFDVTSNPVIASPGNVTAGDDVGALATYPTSWSTRLNQGATYNPLVDVGAAPVMRVTRPETATRVASVAFMGLSVDYSEGPPTLRRVLPSVLAQ